MAKKLVDKVEIPEGITAELQGNDLKVSGNGKENTRHFKSINVVLKKEENVIEVWSKDERRNMVAESRTVASHIRNMITGLSEEFVYNLTIIYSHFPMNVQVKDGFVEVNNLAGAKHLRKAKILGSTKVEVKGKDVVVKGHNKELVGQTAANIEQATKIKGKDVRVYQDGIYIVGKNVKG